MAIYYVSERETVIYIIASFSVSTIPGLHIFFFILFLHGGFFADKKEELISVE